MRSVREFHTTLRKLVIAYFDDKSDANKKSIISFSRSIASLVKDYYVVLVRKEIENLRGIVRQPALVGNVIDQSTSYSDAFQTMLQDWVWQDDQSLQGEVKAIDIQVEAIDGLISDILKEIPEIEPPKMKLITREDWSSSR